MNAAQYQYGTEGNGKLFSLLQHLSADRAMLGPTT